MQSFASHAAVAAPSGNAVLARARALGVALGLTLGLSLALAPQQVLAAPVVFTYAGTITQVAALDPTSPFPDAVDVGTQFNGTYTFESDAVNGIVGDPSSGSYASPLGTLTLNLGGLSFMFTGISVVVVDSPGFDFYGVVFAENPSDNNPTGVLLSLSLQDLTGTALSSNALTVTPPALSRFDTSNAFFFTDTINGNQVEVGGTLDALAVPEPPLPVALVMAAAAMATWRRRRSRTTAAAIPHQDTRPAQP